MFVTLGVLGSLVAVGSTTLPAQAAPTLPASIHFEQWNRNTNNWVPGNLNNVYNEGDTVPFRVDITGVPAGQYQFSICRDFTNNSGDFGYLFLDRYDTTVTPVVGASTTNTVGGVTGAVAGGGGANVTIDNVNETGLQGSCNQAGVRETIVTLTIADTPTAAYVLFGGHLAAPTDAGVGPGNGASQFNGASLQMKLDAPAKTLPINVAPQTTGVVTIIKNAIPDSAQGFNFVPSAGINGGTNFPLVDDGIAGAPFNTVSFTVNPSGPNNPLTVTETPVVTAGYVLSAITCTSTIAGDTSSGVVATGVATFNVSAGERVTCTFTNAVPQVLTGTLAVVKALSPGSDPGTFDLGIDGTVFAAGVGNGGTTGPQVVAAGAHLVSEAGAGTTVLGNYQSTVLCVNSNGSTFPANGVAAPGTSLANVPVGSGESVLCTIANTRLSGTIRVIKDVAPLPDNGLFNLLVDGNVVAPNVDTTGDTGPMLVDAGTHTVGETAGTNTDLANYTSSIECVNPTGNDGSPLVVGSVTGATEIGNIPVPPGANVVCTITNTGRPIGGGTGTLQVVKNLEPSNDPGHFNLRIDGVTQATNVGDGGATPAVVVNTGLHTVGEVGNLTNLANYTSSIVCTHPVNNVAVTLVSGPGATLANVPVASGDAVTCTITNTRRPPDQYGTDPGTLPQEQPYAPVPGTQPAGNTGQPGGTDQPSGDPGAQLAGTTTPVTPVAGSSEDAGNPVTEAVLDAVETQVNLPRTGGEIIQQAIAGLILVGAGLLLLAVRRRRSPSTPA